MDISWCGCAGASLFFSEIVFYEATPRESVGIARTSPQPSRFFLIEFLTSQGYSALLAMFAKAATLSYAQWRCSTGFDRIGRRTLTMSNSWPFSFFCEEKHLLVNHQSDPKVSLQEKLGGSQPPRAIFVDTMVQFWCLARFVTERLIFQPRVCCQQ